MKFPHPAIRFVILNLENVRRFKFMPNARHYRGIGNQ